jgi:hypothetical protein
MPDANALEASSWESGLHQLNEQFLRQYWVNCIALILNRLCERSSADRGAEIVKLFAVFPFSSSNQALRKFFLLQACRVSTSGMGSAQCA